MGLLSNLLKSVSGETLSQLKETITAAVSELEAKAGARVDSQAPSYSPATDAPDWSDAKWREYFLEILKTDYSGFDIREDVPVTEIAGSVADEFQLYRTRPKQVYRAEWGQPYTFVMYQGGDPKAVVMLGSGHSHYSNVKYLIARMYAKKCGLPYINFYTQMPNERAYVVSRIGKFV